MRRFFKLTQDFIRDADGNFNYIYLRILENNRTAFKLNRRSFYGV